MLQKSSLQESSASSIPQADRSIESTARQTPETQNPSHARPTLRRLAESRSPDTALCSRPSANSVTAESTIVPSSNTYRRDANFSSQPHAGPRQSYFQR